MNSHINSCIFKVFYNKEVRRREVVIPSLPSYDWVKSIVENIYPQLNSKQYYIYNKIINNQSKLLTDSTINEMLLASFTPKINIEIILVPIQCYPSPRKYFHRPIISPLLKLPNTSNLQSLNLPLVLKEENEEWFMISSASNSPATTALSNNFNHHNHENLYLPNKLSDKLLPTTDVSFTLNNKLYSLTNVSSELTLAQFLRNNGFTSVKIVCNEINCGSCTVSYKSNSKETSYSTLCSCQYPLLYCDGYIIVTNEFLGSSEKGYHPIQKALASTGGSQCGYCSSGFIMPLYSLLSSSVQPTTSDIENLYINSANICRCTGYRSILSGLKKMSSTNPMIQNDDIKDIEEISKCCRFPKTLSSTTHPEFYRPNNLSDTLQLLQMITLSNLAVRCTVGNTANSILKYYQPISSADVIIDITHITELTTCQVNNDYLEIGGAVTFSVMINFLQSQPQQIFKQMAYHIKQTGHYQLHNVAGWAGNLMLAKSVKNFCSDLWTLFSVLQAIIVVKTSSGTNNYSITEFMSRQSKSDELIVQCCIPIKSYDIIQTYRANFFHAVFGITLTQQIVTDCLLAFGNITSFGPFIATQTAKTLIHHPLDSNTLSSSLTILQQELQQANTASFSHTLSLSFFYRFYLSQQSSLPKRLQSASSVYQRPESTSQQKYSSDPTESPVSQPIPNLASLFQTSGHALYIDDYPPAANQLYLIPFFSDIAYADINKIDCTQALSVEGVIDIMTAADISPLGGSNDCGMFPGDETVFAADKIYWYGQQVAAIVATSPESAYIASKYIKMTTTPIKSPILSISEAIEKKSFLKDNKYMQAPPPVTRGDTTSGFSKCKHVYEGIMDFSAQEHFYLETQSVSVDPTEEGGLKVRLGTQGPTDTRVCLSMATGLKSSLITVDCPRVGGAFGGKLTRGHPLACAAGLACLKYSRPIRAVLSREMDFLTTGHRNPTMAKYKVGYNDDGKIIALYVNFYLDCGYAYDINFGNGGMAILWLDNVYYIPNFYTDVQFCRTNYPPNTAMRSPGAINGIMVIESIIEEISDKLNISSKKVRETNFYSEGQLTPYLQPLENISIPSIWKYYEDTCQYNQLVDQVTEFNKNNRWIKQGISLIPIKHPISYEMLSAMVQININSEDAYIVVYHGGCEIGQGIHTKVAQAVSYKLQCPLSMITNGVTSTRNTPNVSMTGGSITSETCVKAALEACDVLNQRLKPYRTLNSISSTPEDEWLSIIQNASSDGINLSSTGIFAPQCPTTPFDYFVYAGCLSIVQLDILTSTFTILKSDICCDYGQSLNPLVDIGQTEGGFIQGVGMCLHEHVSYDQDGKNLNSNTWNYHLPRIDDIPVEFNVTLLDKMTNPSGVLNSKAVGEISYQLASSVLIAIRECLKNSRQEIKATDLIHLDTPTTAKTRQDLCQISIEQFNLTGL